MNNPLPPILIKILLWIGDCVMTLFGSEIKEKFITFFSNKFYKIITFPNDINNTAVVFDKNNFYIRVLVKIKNNGYSIFQPNKFYLVINNIEFKPYFTNLCVPPRFIPSSGSNYSICEMEFYKPNNNDLIKNSKPILPGSFDSGTVYFFIPKNELKLDTTGLQKLDCKIKVLSANRKILTSEISIKILKPN
ncbi:MAG TPA: hypothetical protein PKY81_10480 [bacterium]|nr:hypothetical protein [bacterium]